MFFKGENIKTLNWPSRSPGLNIFENIFAYLSKKLYPGGKLCIRVRMTYGKFCLWGFREGEIEYIKKLYDSMSRKMYDVLIGQSKLTNYKFFFFKYFSLFFSVLFF